MHKHFVSAAALVTNAQGEVLLVNSPWRGWEYPGGVVETGESIQEALKREVREETGVEIEITGFVGICKNIEKEIVNLDFTARYVSGDLTTSAESSEVIWVSSEEAMKRITFPLTQKRLERMLSGREKVSVFSFRREPFQVLEEGTYPIGNR